MSNLQKNRKEKRSEKKILIWSLEIVLVSGNRAGCILPDHVVIHRSGEASRTGIGSDCVSCMVDRSSWPGSLSDNKSVGGSSLLAQFQQFFWRCIVIRRNTHPPEVETWYDLGVLHSFCSTTLAFMSHSHMLTCFHGSGFLSVLVIVKFMSCLTFLKSFAYFLSVMSLWLQ